MGQDVLLHRIARLDAGAHLAVDLVPGATDLGGQVTAERGEVLVKLFAAAAFDDAAAHALEFGHGLAIPRRTSLPQAVTALARALDQNLGEIDSHEGAACTASLAVGQGGWLAADVPAGGGATRFSRR